MIGDDIRAHAAEVSPQECCGLVIRVEGRLEYVRCRNMAVGDNEFMFHPQDYAEAEDRGEICAVVHSHPNGSAEMSPADKESFEYAAADWMICGQDGNIVGYKCNQLQEASHGDD
jgi:proteasome lid subunit RPN8/RPN11